MRTLVLVVFLISVLVMPAFAYDWATSPVNGHSYVLVDSVSWTDAENQAIALGGHLATVRNNAENDWIYQFAESNKASCYRLWLGLNKPLDDSGSAPAYGWSWTSGEPVSFTNWVNWMNPSGWANNHGYMFVRYWDFRDEQITRWGPCDDESYPGNPTWTTGIVEVVPVPEPSSLLALGSLIAPLVLLKRRK